MKKLRIALLAAFLLCVIIVAGACGEKGTDADTTGKENDTTKVEETTNGKDKDTTADTDKADEPSTEPEFTNPLTGLASETDISKKRPVSIMVNNIGASLPQEGIGQADILYECLAEGGITRLMMIVTDYEKLTKVGSVRSARDYYIDYADGYDCIFVHAGGSTYAYNTFSARGTNRLDGVNGPTYSGLFERDPQRLQQFALEHTLVVKTGEALKNAIEHYKYRTETKETHREPMKFVAYNKTAELDNKATHTKVVVSNYQTVDYVYSEDTGLYSRYQYNGKKHIDNTTGEQLAFKNVVVLFTKTADIPGDDKARISIGTTGSGSGWYITEGTYQKITWKKDGTGSVIKYYYEDGTEVEFNRGKTMINVVPTFNESKVKFDNEWTEK